MEGKRTVGNELEQSAQAKEEKASNSDREAPWAQWRRLLTNRYNYGKLAIYLAASVPGTFGALELFKLGPYYSIPWFVGTILAMACLPGLLCMWGIAATLLAVFKLFGLIPG